MLDEMLVIVLIMDFYTLKLDCDPKNPSHSNSVLEMGQVLVLELISRVLVI